MPKYTTHWQKVLDQKELIETIKRAINDKVGDLMKQLEAEEKRLAVMEYDFDRSRKAKYHNAVDGAIEEAVTLIESVNAAEKANGIVR